MLRALVCGLPQSALDLVKQSTQEVFGEGVEVEVLERETLVPRLRLAAKDPSVVLVSLDEVSEKRAQGKDRGTLDSPVYAGYSSSSQERLFIETLNRVLGSTLEVPKEPLREEMLTSPVAETSSEGYSFEVEDQEGSVKDLQKRLRAAEFINKNLRAQLEEVSEKDTSFSSELLEARGTLTDERAKVQRLESELKRAREQVEDLQSREEALNHDRESLKEDLADLNLRYNQQSSLLRDKTASLESLQAKVSGFTQSQAESRQRILELESEVTTLRASNSTLLQVQGQNAAYASLNSQKESVSLNSKEVLSLQTEVQTLRSQLDEANADLVESDQDLQGLQSELEDLVQQNESLKQTVVDLNQSLLDTPHESDGFQDSAEVNRLRRELAEVQSTPYYAISNRATPITDDSISLLPRHFFDNVKFIFSGTNSSQRDLYTNLFTHLKAGTCNLASDPRKPTLVVDISPETQIDYAFRLREVKTGITWFDRGGSVAPYLTSTPIENVKVLSPGLRRWNDFYFLDIDWGSRLQELNESGYNVILVGGSLSNGVSRVLYENFSRVGESQIVTQGQLTSARNLVLNYEDLKSSSSELVFLNLQRESGPYLKRLKGSPPIVIDTNGVRQQVNI